MEQIYEQGSGGIWSKYIIQIAQNWKLKEIIVVLYFNSQSIIPQTTNFN